MKKKKRWTIIILIIFVFLILVFPGCDRTDRAEVDRSPEGEEEVEEREEPVEENDQEEKETEDRGDDEKKEQELNYEEEEEFASHPFTGQAIEEENFSRAVLAVIDNLEKVRPQDGLTEAHVVYEVMVEGGITRLLALYWDDLPERIGPIRSARPYMIDIAREYNALMLHAGGSPEGLALLQEENIESLDQMKRGSFYWRSSQRSSPHNLYTGASRLEDFIDELTGQEYQSRFDFQPITIISGDEKQAEEISIRYWINYSVNYRYNADNNNYRRYINGFDNPHRVTGGQQITVDNIVVRFTPAQIKDDVGRLKIDFEGEGRAVVFRDGVAVEGRWEKDGNGYTRYYRKDTDEKIDMKPGKTWIQIVPETAHITYSTVDEDEDSSSEDSEKSEEGTSSGQEEETDNNGGLEEEENSSEDSDNGQRSDAAAEEESEEKDTGEEDNGEEASEEETEETE